VRGEVRFEGRRVVDLHGADLHGYRARVGYVQQDPYAALPPFMNVRRILGEPLIVHGMRDRARREQRIRQVLEEVRLSPPDGFLGKFPHMLSGGQQQRVVIARALILEPAMIIADEPVSMLDASVRVEILNLLRHIRDKRGLTLAFITHDLSTVMPAGNARSPAGSRPACSTPPPAAAFIRAVRRPSQVCASCKILPPSNRSTATIQPAGCMNDRLLPRVTPGCLWNQKENRQRELFGPGSSAMASS